MLGSARTGRNPDGSSVIFIAGGGVTSNGLASPGHERPGDKVITF